MPVTLRSPSFAIRQLRLRAMYAFQFMCKPVIVNTCHILRVLGIKKTSDLVITSLSCTVSEILIYFLEIKELTSTCLPEHIPSGVI